MGIKGFTTTSWKHDTLNCSDKSKPMNAWGTGLPQRELEKIKGDESIVAVALQEAWNCASPPKVNEVLGFKTASREQNGSALLARYGFVHPPTYERVDARLNSWLVGGDVCLNVSCSASVPMYSVHFEGSSNADLPPQSEALVRVLRAQTGAHLFMGDLNAYRVDRWSPLVPCATPDKPERARALELIEAAGYIDAWKRTQDGEGWTGMASRPGCGKPAGNLFKRIDYVFAKGLDVVRSEQFARVAPGADAASDHAGLIADIAWPQATSERD
jgi:endonuclease/exonuclease/phosphatase family metal-dependent hydrolase